MLKKSDPIVFVATNNATNARKFYEKILGLTFVGDDQFALVFDANGTMLRIQKVDNVSPQKFTVLGWRVADISDEVDALSKRGVRFERYDGMNQNESGIWMAPSKAKIAWFKDPDGNVLSLTEFAEG